MKYLIVGLGNIGDEYANTRHNIGFMVLDAFAEASNLVFKDERYGAIAEGRVKNKEFILLKPNTYMNLSGNAVRYWATKEKIDVDHIFVVVDDLSLPFGKIRIKGSGSAGGHNGLKNIQELLGTEKYARLKFGIGNDFPKGKQVDFVLGEFSEEDKAAMPERKKIAADDILTVTGNEIQQLLGAEGRGEPVFIRQAGDGAAGGQNQ